VCLVSFREYDDKAIALGTLESCAPAANDEGIVVGVIGRIIRYGGCLLLFVGLCLAVESTLISGEEPEGSLGECVCFGEYFLTSGENLGWPDGGSKEFRGFCKWEFPEGRVEW
jgi:hypothetical protein